MDANPNIQKRATPQRTTRPSPDKKVHCQNVKINIRRADADRIEAEVLHPWWFSLVAIVQDRLLNAPSVLLSCGSFSPASATLFWGPRR